MMRWLAVACLLGGIGFAISGLTLTGQTSSAGDATEPSVPSGEVLFVAKGCATCHALTGISLDRNIGPDLSALSAPPESVRRSIVDPAAELAEGFTWPMPDLGLSEDEVAALVEFLTTRH